MINKTIKALMTLIAISSLSSFAYAGSFGIGVSGNIASVSASGSESESANRGTENSVRDATAGNEFAYGSIFAEYNFGERELFTLGVDYIPGTADVNRKTISRTDATADSAEVDQQNGTRTANAELSDHITYYAELATPIGLYGKIGFAQVDVKTKDTETHAATTDGLYPDKTLDAWTYGIGYKGSFGNNGFFKVEGFYTDYDQYSATSSSAATSASDKTVKADLDVVGASLKLGYKF